MKNEETYEINNEETHEKANEEKKKQDKKLIK